VRVRARARVRVSVRVRVRGGVPEHLGVLRVHGCHGRAELAEGD
jgi:hypothetical protein